MIEVGDLVTFICYNATRSDLGVVREVVNDMVRTSYLVTWVSGEENECEFSSKELEIASKLRP